MFNPYAEELTAADGESLLNQGGWRSTEQFAEAFPGPSLPEGRRGAVFNTVNQS